MAETAQAAFEAALADAETADAAFAALESLARETVGVRLFTVMTLDTEAQLARRAYSSHPADYPTSGTKPIEANDWYAHVVEGRCVFAANTLSDIAAVFPDHALIGSLGCGAVLNLPVIVGGRVVATINLLDAEGAYPPGAAARAEDALASAAEAALARVAELSSAS